MSDENPLPLIELGKDFFEKHAKNMPGRVKSSGWEAV
jgi:hypothetical protein